MWQRDEGNIGPLAESYAEGHFTGSVAIFGIKRCLLVAQMKIIAQHLRQSFDRAEHPGGERAIAVTVALRTSKGGGGNR